MAKFGGGKQASNKSPSLINRVFDILQRGQYASAEGVRKVLEPGDGSGLHDILNFTTGAQEGLLGHKKTSFTDVLKEHGVKGPVAAVGGLAGDILLDPTTYLTFGTTKAGELALAKTIGGRAGVETAKLAKLGGELAPEIKEAGAKAYGEFIEKSLASKTKFTKAQARNAANKAMVEEASKTAQKLALTPGSINMKFMGKEIGSSERAYRVAQTIGRGAGSTKVGSALNKTFRTAATYPGMTNVFRRQAINAGYARLEETHKALDVLFKGTTEADRKLVTHAVEAGTDLTEVAGEHGADLEAIRQKLITRNEELYNLEKSAGLHEADDSRYIENYIHHTYRSGTPAEQRAFKKQRIKAVGGETPGFTKVRTQPTIAAAKKAGLDPVEDALDIMKLREAKHSTVMARKEFVDNVVGMYGVDLTNSGAKRAIRSQGLRQARTKSPFIPKNTFFPDNIARTLEALEKIGTDEETATGFLRLFDKGQQSWKLLATGVNPGHHVRNLVGDMWMGYIDGVNDPRRYQQAMKLMLPSEVVDNAKEIFKVGKNGTITGEDLMKLYIDSGAKSGMVRQEFGTKLGKVRSFISDVSQKREDFARLAHFIEAFEDEAKRLGIHGEASVADVAIQSAAARAAQRVRKFHVDYGDLTEAELRWLRRAIPFYTFARKNIPLQIEALATAPGRIAKIPKGIRAIETMLGQDSRGIGGLATVPDWIKEMAPIQLGEDTFMTPPLPFYEAAKYGTGDKEDIFKNLLSQLTPAIKIPIEQATGESLFSGAPNPSMLEYILNQIPSGRVAGKLVGGEPGKLLNYLTGAGIQGVTPQMKRGAVIQTRKEQKEARKR